MTRDFMRKVLFSYFLPYGFLSRNALDLALRINPMVAASYSGDSPQIQELVRICDSTHNANNERATDLIKNGYLTQNRKFHNCYSWSKFTSCYMTRPSFYLLTGTPDPATEQKRIAFAQTEETANNRIKKEMSYYPNKKLLELNQLLYDLQNTVEQTPENIDAYNATFSNSVSTWEITPLANSMKLAEQISMTPQNMNAYQQYRAWRIANAMTLFRVNGFLTYLDRRPIDTGWTIAGINSEEDYEQRKKDGQLDIPAFTFHALRKWYGEHPDSFSFTNPDLSLSQNLEMWKSTPTLYATYEIPGFANHYFDDFRCEFSGQNNILRHTFIGVGIGTKNNYIIYHTKSQKAEWITSIEKTTAAAVQHSLDSYSPENPIPGAGRTLDHAIMLCCGLLQFASLFSGASLDASPKEKMKAKMYGYPYKTLSLVPINGSGSVQLGALMRSTPDEINEIQKKRLLRESGFLDAKDSMYHLGFNGKRVFLAYNMEYYRLLQALQDYQNHMKFYVACFPDQVKYIQKIMPDVEFI